MAEKCRKNSERVAISSTTARTLLLGVLATTSIAITSPSFAEPTSSINPTAQCSPILDHHIHLGSDELARQLDLMHKADPTAFEHLSKDIFKKPTVSDAMRNLDEAGVKRAVLLSTAYWFMLPGLSDQDNEAERKMRAENQFNVDAALASNGRIVTFVAINPLSVTAKQELEYWAGKPGVGGLKLHLGAAGFTGSAKQVAQLRTIFTLARQTNLPIAVHLRGGSSFTRADVNLFITKILPKAGDVPIQIAHGGGYAGADPATISSLEAFGDAIARKAPGTQNLVFDISGVVLPEPTATALGTSDAQLTAFVKEMRKIGLDRFVLGSDWPAIGPMKAYFELMRRKLPVTDAEWTVLCNNVAPYLRDSKQSS